MINICFKRAKFTDKAGLFHPDYIVEYYDETKFPAGSFPPSENWESLSEVMFKKELKKNTQLQADYLEQTNELERLKAKQIAMLNRKNEAEEKQLLREFEAFKKWRKKK